MSGYDRHFDDGPTTFAWSVIVITFSYAADALAIMLPRWWPATSLIVLALVLSRPLLLGIWVGLGRGLWLARAAAATLSLVLVALAAEHEIENGLATCYTTLALVAAPLLLLRSYDVRLEQDGIALSQPKKLQFSLRRLFLLTACTAAVAMISSLVLPAVAWLRVLTTATLLAAGAWLALWLVLGVCRAWLRLPLLIGCGLAQVLAFGALYKISSQRIQLAIVLVVTMAIVLAGLSLVRARGYRLRRGGPVYPYDPYLLRVLPARVRLPSADANP